jgi:hypothetical protein
MTKHHARCVFVLVSALLAVPSIQAADEAGDVADLDAVEVNAARESEILARMVLLGLERRPSRKEEDAMKVVCEKSARLGTNVKTIRCATNATWLNVAQASINANAEAMADIAGSSTDLNTQGLTRLAPLVARAAANSPYSSRQYDGAREGQVMEFGAGIQRQRARFGGSAEEQQARLQRLFAEDLVAEAQPRDGVRTDPKRVVAYAAVRLAMARAAEQGAVSPEQQAAILAAEGLDAEAYAGFERRYAEDVRFESLVARARDALTTQF